MQETAVTDTSAASKTGGPQGRKTEQSRMLNWIIQFPRRQQQLLVAGTSEKHRRTVTLLINQGAVTGGQG
jgi:hypothetical protein